LREFDGITQNILEYDAKCGSLPNLTVVRAAGIEDDYGEFIVFGDVCDDSSVVMNVVLVVWVGFALDGRGQDGVGEPHPLRDILQNFLAEIH
jgi:hypothetical protein